MGLEALVEAGFTQEEARKLAESNSFHHKKKTNQELTDLFNKILGVYDCTFDDVKRAVLSFPQFAGYDHERVIRQGIEIYGRDNEDKVKRAVLSFPQFAGYDHERVIRQGIEIYGRDNEDKIKRAVLSFPQFAGLDHERVVRQGIEVYGRDNEDKIKKAILIHPQFAGYDHERVIRQGIEIYGRDNEDKVKRAVLSFPQFAGYDHERVIRQKKRLGRIAGLSDEETINYLLDSPALAGYSAKRYLAAFDIGRQLKREGFPQDEKMLESFFSYFKKSPYVPNTSKKRISQVGRGGITNYEEPPLLIAMRKRLTNQQEGKKYKSKNNK